VWKERGGVLFAEREFLGGGGIVEELGGVLEGF
jgi:hypothetical protein